MQEIFLWNARRSGSVRGSRIRNFTIEDEQGVFVAIAWASDSESFKMGIFEKHEEAEQFIEKLHKQIEKGV